MERKITTAWIVSTEFVRKVRPLWNPRFIEADTARLLIGWCVEYYDTYNKAPFKDMEVIYTTKLKEGLDKEKAEWIESILANLSEEYEGQDFAYLVDEAKIYFEERNLAIQLEDAKFELEKGNTQDAIEIISGYHQINKDNTTVCNPFAKEIRAKVTEAFAERGDPLIQFGKALGQFWDSEMLRQSFVAIMGREKIGKTFLLIATAFRAVRAGRSVAFFQAGDMSEKQQIRRMAIHLARRSDEERYCQGLWVPTYDCLWNQLGECNNKERESNKDGLFDDKEDITYEALLNAAMKNSKYLPCRNCDQLRGSPWLKWQPGKQPLTSEQAYKYLREFGRKYSGQLKLSSHANETLSLKDVKTYLNEWEREDFHADVVIIDYADILVPDSDVSRLDYRQQQDRLWKRLRNLSQEKDCLVLTATQIKAGGYGKKLLSLDDFSEDKRKYAHVTAMYGLNQSSEEKRIGLLRINEVVVREADYDPEKPVTVLQRLQMGQPILGSYF